jgi:ApaG protein
MSGVTAEEILITVDTEFQPDVSDAIVPSFFFAYKIKIKNNGSFPVKLLKRKWEIYDSIGERMQVEGAGVVGLQPEILPSTDFEYQSHVTLKTGIGTMRGAYVMLNKLTREEFEVEIPEFVLEAPFVNN